MVKASVEAKETMTTKMIHMRTSVCRLSPSQENVVEEGKEVVIGDVVAREITQRTQKPQMTTKHRNHEVVEDRDVAGEVVGADKIKRRARLQRELLRLRFLTTTHSTDYLL